MNKRQLVSFQVDSLYFKDLNLMLPNVPKLSVNGNTYIVQEHQIPSYGFFTNQLSANLIVNGSSLLIFALSLPMFSIVVNWAMHYKNSL